MPDGDAAESSVRVFKVDQRRVVTCLLLLAAVGLGSVAIIVVSMLYDFPEPVFGKRVVGGLTGGIGTVLAIVLFVENWKRYGRRIELLDGGFRFHGGGQTAEVKWDEVTSVWFHSSSIGGSRELTDTDLWIDREGGRTIHLTSFFRDMPALADAVLRETAERMIPEAWAQLQSGRPVSFGPLQVTSTELINQDRELAWSDVRGIRIYNGAIEVLQQGDKGSWFYTPIKSLPNHHVFLAVADRIMSDTAHGA